MTPGEFVEVFPGLAHTGNVCSQVRIEDVDGLVLIIDALTFEDDRAFIAFR